MREETEEAQDAQIILGDPLLGIACPTILYPYVRETVSDMVTRAGFPPVLLAPVSFEALYAQRQQQKDGGADPRVELAS